MYDEASRRYLFRRIIRLIQHGLFFKPRHECTLLHLAVGVDQLIKSRCGSSLHGEHSSRLIAIPMGGWITVREHRKEHINFVASQYAVTVCVNLFPQLRPGERSL